MSNQNSIFRKASLDRVSSPEQLNDYIKVSRPSVWLILTAIILLLVGACIWGVFGTLTTTCDTIAVVQGGKAVCYVTPSVAQDIAVGMELKASSSIGHITSVAAAPMEITADFDTYVLYLSGWKASDWVTLVTADIAAPDGTYNAKIVLENISPVSFVLN
ncbi:MAG: hypothetical protein RR139_11715 [Lachnospiraceae bacterium]